MYSLSHHGIMAGKLDLYSVLYSVLVRGLYEIS